MNQLALPSGVQFLLSRLNSCGYSAYIVGGCVRDYILGKEPYDYDITTSATPDEMKNVFFDLRSVDTGIKHGTVTFILDEIPYEITTFRCDGEYQDHRHPLGVSFTRQLSDDLSRRDFTMNAIAYNSKEGFVDLFRGRDDIESRLIRAVGDPKVRFSEDALRILRAIRFSAVLNFSIESTTASAAREASSLLKMVSAERIAAEWKKLLAGVGAYGVIREYYGIIKEFFLLEEINLADEKRFFLSMPKIRELSLFVRPNCDPVRDFLTVADSLKYDNKYKRYGATVLAYRNRLSEDSSFIDIKRLLSEIGLECALGVVNLRYALGDNVEGLLDKIQVIVDENQAFCISDLKISGRELLELGITGARIGEVLKELLDCVIDGEIKNDKNSLESAAAKMLVDLDELKK